MDQRNPLHTIGLILSNVANDYFGHLVDRLGEQFAAHGYRLMVSVTGRRVEKERELLKMYAEIADGILIASDAADYEELSDAVPKEIPVIFLNRKPQGCSCTSIVESNYSAVFQCILSNSANGNDKIALLCANRQLSLAREIIEAYKNAMHSTPSGFHEDWIFYPDNGVTDLKSLLYAVQEKGCNTIFTTTQTLTRQFLDYLLVYNLHTEHPVSLIGFVNKDTTNRTQLAFDSINQPLHELTDLAVQQMLYQINAPESPIREYLLKSTLQIHKVDMLNFDKK